jgi:hypothetical protein
VEAVRGHAAGTGNEKNACSHLVMKPEGNRIVGRPSGRWEDTIKLTLKEWEKKGWTGYIWLRTGTRVKSCAHGHTFGFHKMMRNYQLLKNDLTA